jgi:hypothetical protein
MRSASHLAAIALALTGLAQIVSAQPVELTCKNQYGQEGRVIFDESAHTAAFLYGTSQLNWGDNESAKFTDTEIQWNHVYDRCEGCVGPAKRNIYFFLSRMTGKLVESPGTEYQCEKAEKKY